MAAAVVSGAEEEEGASARKEKAAAGGEGAGTTAGGGGDSDEDDEDVYEVEKILDVKTEDGKILYKVRWKGYSPDDDTWEPEEHLEDCREVLLEFRKKIVDSKPKPVKKEVQKLPLNDDLFEADSEADSDWQSDTKGDMSPKKKKKKYKEKEDKSQDEMQKKKSKSAKGKEKPALECENSSDSLASDSKPKKRTSDSKEDTKDSKKQRREELKDTSKKKGEIKDGKKKMKEEPKENKSLQKGKFSTQQLDAESSMLEDLFSEAADFKTPGFDSDSSGEKQKTSAGKDPLEEENVPWASAWQLDTSASSDDSSEVRVRRKKKKHIKSEEPEDSRKVDKNLERKNAHKKQKVADKVKAEADNKRPATPAPLQKGVKLSADERGRKSTDSTGEVSTNSKLKIKETKSSPSHAKDVSLKSTAVESKEKNVNSRADEEKVKERSFQHSIGENVFEKFILDSEYSKGGNTDSKKNIFKSEPNTDDIPKERSTLSKEKEAKKGESKEKLLKRLVSEKEEKGKKDVKGLKNAKQQTVNLGMDMQLERLTLEDFQKHLDGEDENDSAAEAISPAQLRDAVKNGQYATVKMALNSNEEYNIDQEDASGMTLVMLAAAGGHDDIIRLLIRKGAKVNCKQKNGTTALILAAEKNNLTTAAILLEAGAYVNLQQNNGETALMKACRRGNYDLVRLMIESGADCNISSKHQTSALHFAKQYNNLQVQELLTSHLATLSRVAEDTIKEYFEARLILMEPVLDIACHRLCEGPDYSSEFTYKPPQTVPEGSGILLFIFHANFCGKLVAARLCGPCGVQAVVLNDKFQFPVFLPHRAFHPSWNEHFSSRMFQDSHFIYSFSPIPGLNKLFIRLVEAPTAKVKLLIGAYRVQLP
ncbi:M-phase phosphoprotein 8 isoform X4 [Podarcis raffonei]|uniref:M-phase phosphoprotein 8 isoform X4 n=1 Tax=Podarcis raffonei TaxID=65483 RepID=UPI0023299B21|nr:M-phase phosphoprotein 8 isoform X4 [Podarcis raffonei]